MGFFDFLGGSTAEGGWASGLGALASGLGLTSGIMGMTGPQKPTDTSDTVAMNKYKNNLAKTNGIAALGNIAGIGGDISNIVGTARDKSPGATGGTRAAGIVGSGFSLAGRLSSAAGEGIQALQAKGLINMSDKKAANWKRGLEVAGGSLGFIGNLVNGFKAVKQYMNAKKDFGEGSDERKQAKAAMVRGLIGNSIGALGNVSKIIGNAVNPGSKAQKGAAYTGMVAQLLGGLYSGAGAITTAGKSIAAKNLPVVQQQDGPGGTNPQSEDADE